MVSPEHYINITLIGTLKLLGTSGVPRTSWKRKPGPKRRRWTYMTIIKYTVPILPKYTVPILPCPEITPEITQTSQSFAHLKPISALL